MTVDQVCKITNLCDRTLYKMIAHNQGPRVYRFGRAMRIHPDDFEKWLEHPNRTQFRANGKAKTGKK